MTERWKVRRRLPDVGPEVDKRLSRPELAAEYWRSSRDWISLEIDGWAGCEVMDDVILETLERFATLPHYDEEPA